MTKPGELYACLYAREFPAQASLRLRPEMEDRACVVMEGEPPLQFVCSLTRKARSLGIAYGMTRVEIDTFPDVTALPRSGGEEAAAKAALLECASGFSPRVEDCSEDSAFLCVIDIAGTKGLFGPPETLVRSLLARVRALGITACVAVSGNFHAAIALARAPLPLSVRVVPTGEESTALAALPLTVLDLSEEQAETFSLWGIHTLGMLAALPEKELISRIGQSGKRLRQMARGEMPHLFQPVEPAFTLEERMELDSPIEILDTLMFVVNPILGQLVLRATARVLALASLSITLTLEGGATHSRCVRPALPTNDRQLWIKLLHLDLEAHPPQAAIVAVMLQAEPGSTSKMQLGLFTPQMPEPAHLDVTLARIRAIVGEQNVGCAVLRDTHEPDGFRMGPFRVPSEQSSAIKATALRPAMRKLRPPEAVFVRIASEHPAAFVFRELRYVVEAIYGPWVTTGEWWSPSLWKCEQWDLAARSQDGATLCCCLVRDLLQNQWQMAALYGVPDLGGASHLQLDSQGDLWMGGSTAIARWKPDSHASYLPPMLRSGGNFSSVDGLVTDAEGSIWAGMSAAGPDGGLQHLVGGKWKPFIAPELDGRTLEILDVYKDSHDALWIGTRKQGIYRIVGQKVDHFQFADGLTSNDVHDFYEDREGNIWACTSKGLDKFSDLQVVTYSPRDGIDAEEIHSVISARDGTLWIGEVGVLQSLRNGKMSSIKSGEGLPGSFVTSLLEDHKGRLWVGVDKSLAIYESGKFRMVNRPDGATSGVVTGITEDANNDIWIETTGSGRALLRVHEDKIVDVFPPPMMPQGRKIAADPTGGIWIGTKSGDLIHYRDGRTDLIPFRQDVAMDATSYVEQITAEPDGSVLGATGFGLIGWKQGKKQTLTVQNGLPCNRLFGMIHDNVGNLWLSTECGLVEIADAEMERWWQQPNSHLNVRYFDQLTGVLPGWPPFENAAKTPDGHLWFVDSFLLQTIDPQHLYQNLLPPPVSVEGITADRKLYVPTQDLSLPPLTRELQIDYTALSFGVPQKVRFRYKLEGHDVDWQDAGTRRQAFYNDLRPGTFTFHVIACNNDGVWNETGASLRFFVAPAWFQTTWFRVLCAMSLCLLLAAIYQLRVRSIAKAISARFDERLDERTRMALELHDTFLQTVQGSKMMADDALDPDADQVRMRHALERLSVWLGQAVTEGRAALHALRVSTTEQNHLAEFLDRTAKEYAQRTSISVALTVIGDARDLHPIVRDEIARIAEEAIRNSCLHSKASQLSIELRYGRDLILRFNDNGVGIDPDVMDVGKQGHFGLQGMKERSARIRARITITSTLNAGTQIILNVPGDAIYRREKKSRFSALRTLKLWPRPSHGQRSNADRQSNFDDE